MRDLEGGVARGLRWNQAEADRAIEFFGYLRQSKGRWANEPLVLQSWQAFCIGSTFGWQRWSEPFGRWVRRFRYSLVEIARKNGKALALDTPIPTPDGWTAMGDLSEGDLVYDEAGMPCRVVFATPVMEGRECYRVTFSDGTNIVADAEHLWRTQARRKGNGRQGRRRQSSDDVRTTAEIAATLHLDARRVEWNHSIPVAAPLLGAVAELPVAPYVLGAWLGDGSAAAAIITSVDAEVEAALRAEGVPVRVRDNAHRARSLILSDGVRRGDPSLSQGTVQGRLRALGVLGDKHIPRVYQRASVAQRMALLRGLMDTDGYVSRVGQCELTLTNKRLSIDALELMRGLGFKPQWSEDRATLSGRDIGPRYRVRFQSFTDRPVFGIARKRVRLRDAPTRRVRSQTRQIVGCERVESVPVRCIQVDSPSHLYLAGESMVPTHNTTIGAGVGLYLLDFDDEPGAEVYAAATKRDQAKICWTEAASMVARTPTLAKRIRDIPSRANLHVIETASKFEALGADSDTTDGLNPHGAIIDELHAHRDRKLVDVLETALGARTQPLFFYITTAGVAGTSIYMETHDYATRVVEGLVDDDQWFAYIASLDPDDDWTDPANYIKANPGLGVTVQLDELIQERDRAVEVPGRQNAFRRLRLNMITEQVDRWLSMETWDAAEASRPLAELRGLDCYAGLDLATTTDVAALSLVFPLEEGEFYTTQFFWVPSDNMRRRAERDRVPYPLWAEQHHLTATEGNIIDYDVIREQIRMLADDHGFTIKKLCYDRWNATQLITQLGGDGLDVVPVGQGYASMSAPTRELEKLLLGEKIKHDGNPVMRWMVGNVAVEQDPAGNIKPSKAKSTERIDGVVALIMALSEALHAVPGPDWVLL
ncbi:MAG: terminase TerL endonuclease subunit [Burkholderiaceae bacterium]